MYRLAVFFTLLICTTVGASAQKIVHEASVKPTTEKPYIQSTSKDQPINFVIMGDSLANGLHQGLTRLNKENETVNFVKKSKVNTGFVRVDRYDWNKAAVKLAKTNDYQAAVVLIGLNDLQSFREKGKAYHYKTEGWVERYRERTERMMRDLKEAGLAVYWVSIPIVTPKHYQDDYRYLNTFYKEAAEKIGVRYVDTWAPLAGKNGEYSPFWKDAEGKQVEIRRRDGVHFTTNGYLIFAGIVNDIITNDLKAATEAQQ
jgi:hypothetical protein